MPHPLLLLLLSALLLRRPHPIPTPHPPSTALQFEIAAPIDPPTAVHLAHHHTTRSPLAPLTPQSLLQRPHPSPPPPPPPPLTLSWPSSASVNSRPPSRALLISPLVSRLLVSPENHFVLCPLFHSHHRAIVTHLDSRMYPLSRFSIRDRERLLLSPRVLRFLFVRHPLSHALFVYLNATASPLSSAAYRSFMSKLRRNSIPQHAHELQKVSFPFLLTFLSRQGPQNVHPLFQSQTRLCGFGQVAYTFVGRVEDFQRHINDLDHRLQLTNRLFQTPDPLARQSVEEAQRIFQSRRLMNKAVKLYADDFKNFHYDPHVIL